MCTKNVDKKKRKKKSKKILHALAHATGYEIHIDRTTKRTSKRVSRAKKIWQSNNRQQEIDTKIMECDVIAADRIAYVKQIICSHIEIKSDSIHCNREKITFMRVSTVCYINLAIVCRFYSEIRQCWDRVCLRAFAYSQGIEANNKQKNEKTKKEKNKQETNSFNISIQKDIDDIAVSICLFIAFGLFLSRARALFYAIARKHAWNAPR